MSAIQHTEAKKLLALLRQTFGSKDPLTYESAADALGRNPKTNARMTAQVCDLLDAAAFLAGVPLLALIAVREASGEINRKAWTGEGITPQQREQIIERSAGHIFSDHDFVLIAESLKALKGKGNRAAWHFALNKIPLEQLYNGPPKPERSLVSDAINDHLGSDHPEYASFSSYSFARDPEIRAEVMARARGKCEFCGGLGFLLPDGRRYLESHHIIALAKDGADRMTNVIALCPNDHREAHFGQRREQIEIEMIKRVQAFTQNR